MSNIQSYNALIDRFHAFASGHFILKRFSHGQIEVSDLEKFGEYPFMHVVPSNVTYAKGMKTFSFQIVLADLPRDKEDKPEYQREVLSDLQRIAEDLVAEITNHRMLFGDLITVQNVSLEPFLEEFQHTLTGWTISLDLLVPYYWDACSIPAEWNDMFESGSGGTGSILTFIDSINRDENGNVSLVNDEETPAPNYYYGTNNEGVRGWYLLSDEVGLTCETIGDCQTIIDIEAAIDALEEEIVLKADITSISAVGFSNDYDDLDNKPTIPSIAGLVPDTRTISTTAPLTGGGDLSANRTLSIPQATTTVDGYLSATDWTTFNSKVPATRSLTINGTTQDLSADRTFTIATGLTVGTTPITSGTVGRVLFEGTGNVLQQSANLFWDNTNSRLGIGTTSPAYGLDVNTTSRFTGLLINTAYSTSVQRLQFNNGNPALNIGYIRGVSDGIIRLLTAAEDTFTRLQFGGGTTAFPALQRSGAALCVVDGTGTGLANLLIGTTTDAGFKLDVNGTARVSGQITASSNIIITANSGGGVYSGFFQQNGLPFIFNNPSVYGTQSGAVASASGLRSSYLDAITWAQSSGTAEFASFRATPTINQTGTATGITRGLHINPTLTAAADFRAIEVTAGKVCLNTTSGNTMIGTTTDAGFKLDVNGTARVTGTGSTSATTALTVRNSAGTAMLTVKDGGSDKVVTMASALIASIDISSTIIQVGSGNSIRFVAPNGCAFNSSYASPDASAQLDVASTTKGFLPPRMTTTQKNAIASPAAGLVVYDTTLGKLCVRTASAWETITSV